LREEAVQKRISLNTLANQIIDSHVNYSSNLSKADVIPFTKYEIMILLEGYSEEQIKAIAERLQKKISKEIVLQLRGRLALYNGKAVSTLEWGEVSHILNRIRAGCEI
jgi:GGDEF domain-containing protein